MEPRDLIGYLAEFDLTLADLTAEQVSMFVAARNVAGYVKGLDAPVGSRRREGEEAALEVHQADKTVDLSTYDTEALQIHLPSDGMEVSPIRGVEDLSRIFPVQWLLEELQPDLFYAKLAQRELLMPEWQRPAPGADFEEEAPDRQRVDDEAAAESAKQHAYVLLDVSSTMQDRDRRGIVARGLALEFLRHGQKQGAWLNLRPFAVEVGTLSSGEGADAFRTITRRIIELPNLGQTRIQAALDQAVLDIRGAGPCRGASIILVTDGISRLLRNPLADEKLHTFILGDLFEDTDESGTITTLKQWSETFHHIWQNRCAEIVAPTLHDCQTAARLLEETLRQYRENPSPAAAARLDRLLKNVKYLVSEYRRRLGKRASVPAEVRLLDGSLIAAERTFQQAIDQSPAAAEVAISSGSKCWRRARKRRTMAPIDEPARSRGVSPYCSRSQSPPRKT